MILRHERLITESLLSAFRAHGSHAVLRIGERFAVSSFQRPTAGILHLRSLSHPASLHFSLRAGIRRWVAGSSRELVASSLAEPKIDTFLEAIINVSGWNPESWFVGNIVMNPARHILDRGEIERG